MATTAATILEKARAVREDYARKHQRAAATAAAERARLVDALTGIANLSDVLKTDRVADALKAEYAERWFGMLLAMIETADDVRPSLARWVKMLYRAARGESWNGSRGGDGYRVEFLLDAASEAEDALETLAG